MQRRNFLQLLGGALLAPLAALLPALKSSEEKMTFGGLYAGGEFTPVHVSEHYQFDLKPFWPMEYPSGLGKDSQYYFVGSHLDESIPNQFRSMADACEHAEPGDTIFISGEFINV